MRTIKLPELLIEVDNDLHFTQHFLTPVQQQEREAESVCLILATIMAYGCNIGPYTMARLTGGVDYEQIKAGDRLAAHGRGVAPGFGPAGERHQPS
jgi:hypothetical protein